MLRYDSIYYKNDLDFKRIKSLDMVIMSKGYIPRATYLIDKITQAATTWQDRSIAVDIFEIRKHLGQASGEKNFAVYFDKTKKGVNGKFYSEYTLKSDSATNYIINKLFKWLNYNEISANFKPPAHRKNFKLKIDNSNLSDYVATDLKSAYVKSLANNNTKLTFQYIDGRYYNPVQNIKKSIKSKIFKDWIDTDIKNSAPTLMAQDYKKQTGTKLDHLGNEKVFNEILKATGLHKSDVKPIIISLLFGRGNFPTMAMVKAECGISQPLQDLIDKDLNSALELVKNMHFRMIMADIKLIRSHYKLTRSSHKAAAFNVYVALEDKVMTFIRKNVLTRRNDILWMHDGFLIIDKNYSNQDLAQAIKLKFGYDISFTTYRL